MTKAMTMTMTITAAAAITATGPSFTPLGQTPTRRRRSPSLSICAYEFFGRGEVRVGDVIAARDKGDFFVGNVIDPVLEATPVDPTPGVDDGEAGAIIAIPDAWIDEPRGGDLVSPGEGRRIPCPEEAAPRPGSPPLNLGEVYR
ncbi:hypothetical protein ONZ45_g1485 [Pleurotus djamor]|nr:hypothetical protein ONZ45_g1485 [Pleurotus djamor]